MIFLTIKSRKTGKHYKSFGDKEFLKAINWSSLRPSEIILKKIQLCTPFMHSNSTIPALRQLNIISSPDQALYFQHSGV